MRNIPSDQNSFILRRSTDTAIHLSYQHSNLRSFIDPITLLKKNKGKNLTFAVLIREINHVDAMSVDSH